MAVVYERPHALNGKVLPYCPGCTHGTALKLVAEVIDELGIEGNTVGIASVGCTYNAYEFFNCDMVQAAHGRAPAVATGVKRVNPENIIFTYQGDGDLASIGMAEIIHAAVRGENITVVFANNAVYGMTSGQMAPTSLIDQKTTTSPYGRDASIHGYPIKVSEMLATIEGASYIERVSMHDIKNIKNAKKAIKKGFQVQMAGKGFSIIEVLSSCPTNWGTSPIESLKWIEEKMLPVYPLGIFKGKDLEV